MYCSEWKEGTDDIWPVVYPCDVIKVLDWAEQAYDDGWKACDFQWREL
jgi:hypothetical protein